MILDTLLAKLAPYECLGCNAEGQLLCENCTRLIQRVPSRCYRCRRVTEGFKTCQTCTAPSSIAAVFPFAVYADMIKALVLRLKFSGTQAAASEMARLIAVSSPWAQGMTVVPVPTATSRVRKRGYDQSVLLAKALASQQKLNYGYYLRRSGQDEQLGATREQRITQLKDAYRCANPRAVRGADIVLIDDVLTTGSTLEAAARALKMAGARSVRAIVFAQV